MVNVYDSPNPAQSAAAHRLHPEESEVAALVRRRVAAELGGPDAEALADAIIEVWRQRRLASMAGALPHGRVAWLGMRPVQDATLPQACRAAGASGNPQVLFPAAAQDDAHHRRSSAPHSLLRQDSSERAQPTNAFLRTWLAALPRCLQAAEARAARQPLDKRPHTVEELLQAGGERGCSPLAASLLLMQVPQAPHDSLAASGSLGAGGPQQAQLSALPAAANASPSHRRAGMSLF